MNDLVRFLASKPTSKAHARTPFGTMELASIAWADGPLQAARIDCEVYSFNAAVLALHKRHGFTERDRYQRERNGEALEVVRLWRSVG